MTAGDHQIISNHWLRLRGWSNPTFTAAIAALSDLVTRDVPTAVVAGVVAELTQRYRRLSEDEMSIFNILGKLAHGGSIYRVWISEEDLLKAMDPELDLEARRRLLANMESRGILEEGAGKWRAVW